MWSDNYNGEQGGLHQRSGQWKPPPATLCTCMLRIFSHCSCITHRPGCWERCGSAACPFDARVGGPRGQRAESSGHWGWKKSFFGADSSQLPVSAHVFCTVHNVCYESNRLELVIISHLSVVWVLRVVHISLHTTGCTLHIPHYITLHISDSGVRWSGLLCGTFKLN